MTEDGTPRQRIGESKAEKREAESGPRGLKVKQAAERWQALGQACQSQTSRSVRSRSASYKRSPVDQQVPAHLQRAEQWQIGFRETKYALH